VDDREHDRILAVNRFGQERQWGRLSQHRPYAEVRARRS
jgi:hypothetical protein